MIVHVWQERVEVSPETEKRNAIAAETWKSQGWVERGFNDNHFYRTAANTIKGETKDFPYIKDVLRFGCLGLKDDDIIVFTNADTCVASNFTEMALELLKTFPAIHCHRRDFDALEGPLRDEEIATGKHYPGSDAFVFPVGWWRKHFQEYPDLIFGVNAWDKIMRQLVIKYGGAELKNGIYHHFHDSYWEAVLMTNPSNIYCRNEARKWLRKNNIPLEELNFKETHEMVPSNSIQPQPRGSVRKAGNRAANPPR